MTQTEKAERYDALVREGDVVQRKISKLQSQNAFVNTQSDEYDRELAGFRNELKTLELKMNQLFID
jgi:hypothetical protein